MPGAFVARTKVRDAWFMPPPPDDAAWFKAHPHRKHRVRALHPEDMRHIIIPEPRCSCTDHDFVVIIRNFVGCPILLRLPANEHWPPDDEAKLAKIFDHFINRPPCLTTIQVEEEES